MVLFKTEAKSFKIRFRRRREEAGNRTGRNHTVKNKGRSRYKKE